MFLNAHSPSPTPTGIIFVQSNIFATGQRFLLRFLNDKKHQSPYICIYYLTFRSIVLHINNLNSWTEIYCDIRKIGRWEEPTFSYNTGLSPTEWIRGYKMEKKMIGAHSCLVCAGSRLKTWKSGGLLKIIDRKIHATLPTKSNLLNWIYWIAPISKQLFVEKLKILYLCLCWAWVCKSCTIRFRPLLFTVSPYCARSAPLKRGNVRGTMLGGKVHWGDDVGGKVERGKKGRSRGNSCCVTRAGEGGSSCIVTLGGAMRRRIWKIPPPLKEQLQRWWDNLESCSFQYVR